MKTGSNTRRRNEAEDKPSPGLHSSKQPQKCDNRALSPLICLAMQALYPYFLLDAGKDIIIKVFKSGDSQKIFRFNLKSQIIFNNNYQVYIIKGVQFKGVFQIGLGCNLLGLHLKLFYKEVIYFFYNISLFHKFKFMSFS